MGADLRSLGAFLDDAESLVVLSGAGVSTASGIPDYRDRHGEWKQAQPIQYGDFVASSASRQRYWARSFAGWPRMAGARPNAAHRAVAALEDAGKVDTVITQNVDGLHQQAGSHSVIDLHGAIGRVRCLSCGTTASRADFQQALDAANPGWQARVAAYKPDGDAELARDGYANFQVPDCACCGGLLKPDVVMFGESVPGERVEASLAAVGRASALLVVGSSLMVYSGFRFAREAARQNKPIAIVNRGRTRADDLGTLKVDLDCGVALTAAVEQVRAPRSAES